MKALYAVVLILMLTNLSFASDKIKSRYGIITLTTTVQGDDPDSLLAPNKYTIKLNDKVIYRAETAEGTMGSIELCKLFKVNDADVLLVTGSEGGTIGVDQYWFITITKQGEKQSKDFAAPGNLALLKMKQKGNKIEISYAYDKSNGMTRPPIVYENGEIKIKGK